MREISYEEVRLSVDNITDNQSSLNVGELKTKTDSLDSIILILKECWNTTGGNKKQKRLKEIIDQELDFSKIESTTPAAICDGMEPLDRAMFSLQLP